MCGAQLVFIAVVGVGKLLHRQSVFSLGGREEGGYAHQENMTLPVHPTLMEVATNDLDRRTFQFLTTSPTIGRSFFAPRGVPSVRW